MIKLSSTVGTLLTKPAINITANNTYDVVIPMFRDIPVVFWVFLSIETLVTIIANALLCWLFLWNRKLRTKQSYLIFSLSLSDLLVGLVVPPCEYCALKHPMYQGSECPLFCGSVFGFTMLASTINLVLIAADRYFSIKKPFHYQAIISKRRVVMLILSGWLLTLLLTLLPLSWLLNTSITQKTMYKINLYFSMTLFGSIIVAGVSIAIIYNIIVKAVRDQLRSTNERSTNPAGVQVCIMVSISFFICWIPTCIVEILMQLSILMPPYIYNASYFILLLNSCLNPLMYAYYRHDFQRALASWSRRHWKRFCWFCNILLRNERQEFVYSFSEDINDTNFSIATLLTPDNYPDSIVPLRYSNNNNINFDDINYESSSL